MSVGMNCDVLLVRSTLLCAYIQLKQMLANCLTLELFENKMLLDRKLSQMFVATRYATKIRSNSNVSRYSICDSLKGRDQILGNSI